MFFTRSDVQHVMQSEEIEKTLFLFRRNQSKTLLFQCCATQPVFTCSMLTIETLQQGVKYVQNQQ